jgi:calcineurin-like phosphoesterase family protein
MAKQHEYREHYVQFSIDCDVKDAFDRFKVEQRQRILAHFATRGVRRRFISNSQAVEYLLHTYEERQKQSAQPTKKRRVIA